MAEGINNNNADFHNYLEKLKSKNKKHSEELDMKCKEEEKIHKNFSIDFHNQDWTRCKSNFEELSNNSKEMRQMMKTQNQIAEDTFSLTEKILASSKNIEERLESLENSLENSSKTKQILCYSDWVKILINEIIVPKLVGGQDDWNKISTIFTRSMHQDTEYYALENEEDDLLFERLEEILSKVNITLGEFEFLIKLNKMRNSEYHINNQPLNEAKKQLEMTFPESLKCFKEPLKKALDAIEVQWNIQNRNGNRRRFKRN